MLKIDFQEGLKRAEVSHWLENATPRKCEVGLFSLHLAGEKDLQWLEEIANRSLITFLKVSVFNIEEACDSSRVLRVFLSSPKLRRLSLDGLSARSITSFCDLLAKPKFTFFLRVVGEQDLAAFMEADLSWFKGSTFLEWRVEQIDDLDLFAAVNVLSRFGKLPSTLGVYNVRRVHGAATLVEGPMKPCDRTSVTIVGTQEVVPNVVTGLAKSGLIIGIQFAILGNVVALLSDKDVLEVLTLDQVAATLSEFDSH